MVKISNIDCFEYIKTIEDHSLDLVLTDPPYILDLNGAGDNRFCQVYETQKQQLEKIVDGYNIEQFADLIIPKMKIPNFYFFCSRLQIYEYLRIYVEKYKFNYEILTWHKTNAMPLYHNKYMSDTEFILFFRKGAKVHPKNYKDAKTFFLEPINNKDKQLWGHPTIKPISILETILRNSSEENDLVFDPFMGSGSTGVACQNIKRNFIGCEINEEYFKIAKKRLNIVENC